MEDPYATLEAFELFNILESNQTSVVDDVKSLIWEHLSSIKESWLVYGLYDYCVAKNSQRALEILLSIQEPHDRFLFDKIAESLRGNQRLAGLVVLGYLVRRQPPWLHKICHHGVLRELIRVLKTENDVVVLVHAVLVLTALIPIIPTILSAPLQEFFEVFSRLALWNFNNQPKTPEVYLLHLQIALYALFHRLYGMYPCNFLSYLRQHYGMRENLQVFSHTIKPMLETVRMHPLLVTASKDVETSATRWKQMSVHDIVSECAKYSLMEVHEPSSREELTASSTFNIPALEAPPISSLLQEAINPNHEWTSPSSLITAATPISRVTTPLATPIKDTEAMKQRPPSLLTAARCLSTALDTTPPGAPPTSPLRAEGSDRRGSLIASKMGKAQEPPTFKQLTGVLSGIRSRHSSGAPTQESVTAKSQSIAGAETSPGPMASISNKLAGLPYFDRESSAEDGEVSRLLSSREAQNAQSWMQSRETTPTLQASRPDSVFQDKSEEEEEDEISEEEARMSRSNSLWYSEIGAVQMANKQHISDFVRRVRLRYYSHCIPSSSATYGSPSSNSSFGTVIDVGSVGFNKVSSTSTSSSRLKRSSSCPVITRPYSRNSVESLKPVRKESEIIDKRLALPVNSVETQTENTWPPAPYEHLFLSVLPPSLICPSQPAVNSSPEAIHPTSPAAVLDRYVETAFKNHERQVGLQGTKANINEDVVYLRGQILLLHAQLQFERQQREVHAARIRRLLPKAKGVRALEEEVHALRQQLSSLQDENMVLRKDLEVSKRYGIQLENEKNCFLKEHEQQAKKVQQQLAETSQSKQQLEEELLKLRKEERSLKVQVGQLQGELFDLNAERKELKAEADHAQQLQERLVHSQQELLYARETAHQLQQQLLVPRAARAEEKEELTRVFKEELRICKDLLERERRSSEALTARLAEIEGSTAKKDLEIAEHKRILQAVRDEYDQLMKVLEEKYESTKGINLALENNILQLRQQLDGYRSKQRRRLQISGATAPTEIAQLPLAPGFSASPNSPPSFSSTSGTSPEQLSVSLAVEASEGINDICWQSLESSALAEVAELPNDEQTRPAPP